MMFMLIFNYKARRNKLTLTGCGSIKDMKRDANVVTGSNWLKRLQSKLLIKTAAATTFKSSN